MTFAFDVNFLAVFLCMVIDMVIGSLWYSPVLFLKPWMKLIGIDPKNMSNNQKSILPAMLISCICALIMAFILAVLLKTFGITEIQDALVLAGMLWLGFTFAPHMMNYSYEGRSHIIGLILMSYKLLSIVLMAVLLMNWK